MNNKTMLAIITDDWQKAIKGDTLYLWAYLYEQVEAFNNCKGFDVETYVELDFLQTIVFQIYADKHKAAVDPRNKY